jgi:hypothetical protein
MLIALRLPACVAAPEPDEPGAPGAAPEPAAAVRMLPLHGAALDPGPTGAAEAALAVGALPGLPGPVIAHVSVHPVYWNSATQFQANLNALYRAIPNSTYFDLLAQYGVGRGSGVNGVVDTRVTASVTDATIHTELNRLFSAGALPLPNASNYYPVHFPAGMTITAPDGSRSCVQFCAYHSSFVRAGVNVVYGVIPDQGGACAAGCGTNAQQVNNVDAVSSAELVDAVTDPLLTAASEITDVCGGQQTSVVGGDGATYVVAKFFSNAAGRCVPP